MGRLTTTEWQRLQEKLQREGKQDKRYPRTSRKYRRREQMSRKDSRPLRKHGNRSMHPPAR
jgi:hypothetical protein